MSKKNKIIAEIISVTVDILLQRFNNNTDAILIGGSIGRDEGSAIEKEGKIMLLSDFDFTIIAHNKSDYYYISTQLPELLDRINKLELKENLLSYIDCGVTTLDHILSNNGKLFYFEFINSAKIVYKKNDRFKLPLSIACKIEPTESLILLSNRIVEQLIQFDKINLNNLNKLEYIKSIYLCARTYCDIGKALLISKESFNIEINNRILKFETYRKDGTIDASLAQNIIFGSEFKIGINNYFSKLINADDCDYEKLYFLNKQLAFDLTTVWVSISKKIFSNINEDMSIYNIIDNISIGTMLFNIKTWLIFFVKQNKTNERKLLNFYSIYKFIYRIQPIWISYFSGIIIYSGIYSIETNLKESLKYLQRYFGPVNTDITQDELFKNYNYKIKLLWGILAMGGKHMGDNTNE